MSEKLMKLIIQQNQSIKFNLNFYAMRKSFTRLFGVLMALMLVFLVNVAIGQTYKPADNSSNVHPGDEISVTFDFAVKKGTGSVALYKTNAPSAGPLFTKFSTDSKIQLSADGKKVTFDLNSLLVEKGEYYIIFDAQAFLKVSDNSSAGSVTTTTAWNFTVGDYTAPTLVANSFVPADNTVGLDKSLSTISLSFSEAVGVTTGTERMFLMKEASGSDKGYGDVVKIYTNSGHGITGIGTQTLTIPVSGLEDNATYYVIIESGYIRDEGSNKLAYAGITNKATWNFSTRDVTPPTFVSTPKVIAFDGNAVTFEVQVDKKGTVYYAVGNVGVTTATSVQVSTTTFNTNYPRKGKLTFTAAGKQTFSVGTLTNTVDGGATYPFFFVTETANGGTVTETRAGDAAVVKVDQKLRDIVAPRATAVAKVNVDATNDFDLKLTFTSSTELKLGSGFITIKKATSNVEVAKIDVATSKLGLDNNLELTVPVPGKFDGNTNYYVLTDAGIVTDKANNASVAVVSTTSLTFNVGDLTAPTITNWYPTGSATVAASVLNDGTTGGIKINFSEPIVTAGQATLTSAYLKDAFILKENGTITPTVATYLSANGVHQITIKVDGGTLKDDKEYQLVFQSWYVGDASGNLMSGIETLTFKTSDNVAPSIKDLTAETVVKDFNNSATNYAGRTSALKLTFTEAMRRNNAVLTSAVIASVHVGADLVPSAQYTVTIPSEDVVRIAFANELTSYGEYKVTLATDNLKDVSGNALVGNSTATITVEDYVKPVLALTTPVQGSIANAGTTTITLKFTDQTALYYDGAALSSSTLQTLLVLRRGSSAGEQVNITDVDYSSATGVVTLTSSMTDGHSYFLTLKEEVIHDLFANKNVATSFNFSVGSSAAPVVAKVLGTGVEKYQPLNNEENQALNATVSVEFEQPVAIAAGVASFTLTANPGGAVAVSTVTLSADKKVLTLVHADFAANTEVTVGIATAAVTAQNGTALANNISWSFNTSDTQGPKHTALSPVGGATNVLADAKLGITFDGDATKLKKGTGNIRVYKSSNNSIVHTVVANDLMFYWDGTNTNGTVTITIPALEPNTQYYVLAESGAILDNLDNPWSGISNVASWTFTTATSTFKVSTTTPNVYADNTSLDANVVLTLNHNLGGFDNTKNFLLEDLGLVSSFDRTLAVAAHVAVATPVNAAISDGQITAPLGAKVVTIDPVASLETNKAYRVTMPAGIATDVYNQLNDAYQFIFFTGNTMQGPVATFSPVDGDVGKASNTSVSVSFVEDVFVVGGVTPHTTASLASPAFTIVDSTGPVTYTATITNNRTVNFTLGRNFAAGDVTVTIATGTFYDVNNVTFAGGDLYTSTIQKATWSVKDYTNPAVTVGTTTQSGTYSSTFEIQANNNEAGTLYVGVKEATSAGSMSYADLKALAGNNKLYDASGAATNVFTFSGLKTNSNKYYYYVGAEDLAGNFAIVLSNTFTTGDATAPTVTGVLHAGTNLAGKTIVAGTTTLSLTFNEVMSNSTTGTQAAVVRETVSGNFVGTFSATYTATNVFTLQNFTGTFSNAGMAYTLEVLPNVFKDLAGNNHVETTITRNFSTRDDVAPTITTITFDTDATFAGNVWSIKDGQNIQLTFSESVLAGAGVIAIYDNGTNATSTIQANAPIVDNILQANITGTGKTRTFSISNAVDFNPAKVYVIHIATNTFKDANNNLNQVYNYAFKIADTRAPMADFAYSIAQDANDALNTNIHINTNIHVSFNEDIKWAKLADVALTDAIASRIVTLSGPDGNVDVTVTYGNVSNTLISGATSNTFKVDPKKSLLGNTQYTLTVVDVMDAKENGKNQVYTLNFTTGAASMGTAPVATFNPSHETLQVSQNGPFVVTFDKAVYVHLQNSLTERAPLENLNVKNYFTLVKGSLASGSAVTYTATVTNGNTITITPSQPLVSNASYTFGIVSGKKILDEYGNELVGTASASYGNVTYSTVYVKDWEGPTVTTWAPTGGTDPDSEMYIKFNEDVKIGSGFLYIREYETGALIQKIEANASNLSVEESTVYITKASLPLNKNFYALVDPGFVTDLAGNNYAGIPDVNINSWTFNTKDTVTPMLANWSPAPGSEEVGVGTKLTLTFNKEVKAGTGFISVYDLTTGLPHSLVDISTTAVVFGEVSTSKDTIVTVTLPSQLKSHTDYFVRVSNGAIIDKTTAANKFPGVAGEEWYFTTEDITAATIVARIPADDATDVERNPMFEVHFDRNIAKGSGVISIYKRDGETLVETLNVNSAAVVIDGKELHFHLANLLAANTDYYVYIAPGAIVNASVNATPFGGITTAWGWNFTTGSTIVDRDAPAIVDHSPQGVQATVHQTFVIEFNEAIMAGTGKLHVYEAATDSLVLLLDVADAVIDGNVITFSYDKDNFSLTKSTQYYVLVEAGVVKDAAGNEFGGISSKTMWVFTTGADYATSAPEIAHSNFKLYPNPFNNELNIDNHNKLSRVIITNIAGQRVMDIQFPERTISTSNLVSGVYIVTMVTNEGTTQSERIVKR